MKNRTGWIFFILLISTLFYDIGNLDGLRQGTEGFYLLISQEMYEASSYLSPRIYGDFHWSKPPLQFLYPMPFYAVFGGSYLLWSRVSVLLFSLIICFLISLWYENQLKRNWHEAFSFLLIGFYFLKYSRIFMLEASLCYLTTYGALLAYSFLQKKSKVFPIASSVVTGLSVLIKGPVSLAMIYPSLFIITFFKKLSWKKLFTYYILAFVIGSIWFFLSYLEHGTEFFNYFFIRENLGKFNAKRYPISTVVQGLFVYAFPTFLFLIPVLKKKFTLSNIRENSFNFYALLSFCFFFFLWFLPRQKSHHYAVPSIPIISLFICYNFFELKTDIRNKAYQYSNMIGSLFMITGAMALALIFYFKDSLNVENSSMAFSGAFFLFGFWTYSKKIRYLSFPILRLIVPQLLFWVFLIPLGVLPAVPNKVEALLQKTNQQIFVDYRKPFFVKEALNKEILFFPGDGLKSHEIKSQDYVYIQEERFKILPGNEEFKPLLRWKVWKRGSRLKAILKAVKNQDLTSLQEFYTLVQKQ